MMEKDDVRAKKNVSYHIFTYYPEKPSIYTEYSKAVNAGYAPTKPPNIIY